MTPLQAGRIRLTDTKEQKMIYSKNWMIPSITTLAIVTALTVSGCAQGTESEDSGESDSTSLIVESAVGSVNGAMNDTEQTPSFAYNRPLSPQRLERDWATLASNWIYPSAHAAACSLTRFSPSIGSTSCAGTEEDRTVLSQFDSCTVGKKERLKMEGTVKLSFDAAATCDSWIDGGDLPTSGSVTRTTSDMTRHNGVGTKVTTSSDEHQNYLGETLGGGVRSTFADGSRSIEILGMRRQKLHSRTGRVIFDHSVHTTQALVIEGRLNDGDRRIASGEIVVDHNKKGYSSVATFAGLKWSADCCHPVEGTMTFTHSGSKSGTLSVDFASGECGSPTISNEEGSEETFVMRSCE